MGLVRNLSKKFNHEAKKDEVAKDGLLVHGGGRMAALVCYDGGRLLSERLYGRV